jgi:hypothetical protein
MIMRLPLSMFTLRQVLPYPIVALFILLFFSEGLGDRIKSSLSRNRGTRSTTSLITAYLDYHRL